MKSIMKTNNINQLMGSLIGTVALTGMPVFSAPAEKWVVAEQNGRVEARRGDTLMLAWQSTPLAQPAGGAKFAASAFLHPLRTPSGFEWTTLQPTDHLHHLGLWWPWKFIEIDGARFNCWEIQEGQGAQVAHGVKQLPSGPDKLEWELHNEVVVRKPGAGAQAVIDEIARVALSLDGADAQVIDVALRQRATGSPVSIINYRYSGFSWRGPASWHKDNSRMLTSEGHGRDDANGKPARWVLVSGPTPGGAATVLMMSAAAEVAGTPEHLRVWDSKTGNGTPFVNFNPVADNPLPLDDAHPAVSNRRYRVLAADRLIDAAAAEAAWRKWLGK
jgi:hypothetical protein